MMCYAYLTYVYVNAVVFVNVVAMFSLDTDHLKQGSSSSEQTVGLIKAFDDVSEEMYIASGDVIVREKTSTSSVVKRYQLDSSVVLLELIRNETGLYMFYCLQVDKPSCFVKNVNTSRTSNVTVTETDPILTNFLYYDTVRSHVFSLGTVTQNIRYLAVSRNVESNTNPKYRNAIAVFVIDMNYLTMWIHTVGGMRCMVKVGSPFVLRISEEFHFNSSVYYIAQHPENKAFPAVNVLIQIDVTNGSVIETEIDCLGAVMVTGTTHVLKMSTSAATSTKPDMERKQITSFLFALHVDVDRTDQNIACTIQLSTIENFFRYEILHGNKTTSNLRACTHGHCVFHSPEKYDTYAEEHSAATLFMSPVTTWFSTRSEAVHVAVTRSADNLLAHVLTRDSEVVTVKLWNNSQIISTTNVASKSDNSNSSVVGIANYGGKLYAWDNVTVWPVDVSSCLRHHFHDTCARDLTPCRWCRDLNLDPIVKAINITFYCFNKEECQSPVTKYTGTPTQVLGIQPTGGPKSGGNLITITGDQLDMTQRLNVTIAGKQCRILPTSVVRKSFLCAVPSLDCDVITHSDVMVEYDNEAYRSTYQCTEDPVIHEAIPRTTIISGGTKIFIRGDNFSQDMKHLHLVYAETEAPSTTRRFPCDVNVESNGVSCITPPVRPSFSGIALRMRLAMGGNDVIPLSEGLLHTQALEIMVKPDPTITDFLIKLLDEDEEDIVFQGSNLDAVSADEISVQGLYNGALFNITRVSSTSLHCRIIKKNSKQIYVKVTIGENLIFYPGTFIIGTERRTPPQEDTGVSPAGPSSGKQEPETSGNLQVIIPVLCACAILVIIAVLVARTVIKRRKMIRLNRERPSIVSFHSSMGVVIGDRMASRSLSNASLSDVLLTDGTDDISKEIIRRLEEESLIIKRANLTLQKLIGRGNFGSVFKGIVKTADDSLEVAVKTLHQDEPHDIDIQLFLKEAYVMKDFKHPNVMTLIGICLDLDEMPLVIIPYMEHGDLLTYLHEDKHIPTVKDLVAYGLDIARGMTYLAQLKFVHRDLAARNCMLDSNYTVKVADFGLSRHIYESSYYSARSKGTKLPVKWMAIDSLTNGVFNEKTDVWSYGVTLWELLTRGVRPYATVDNWDMERYLNTGRRLPQPTYCPNQLYRVMRKCWAENPDERPTFEELGAWISDMLERVHHQLGNTDKTTNIQTTYVNLGLGASCHYENEAVFRNEARNEDSNEALFRNEARSIDSAKSGFQNEDMF